jgi:hypothetical protein
MVKIADSKSSRRLEVELAKDDLEKLQAILNQGVDEWLRAYMVGQMKNISLQRSDPDAVSRAILGAQYAIEGWQNARTLISNLGE